MAFLGSVAVSIDKLPSKVKFVSVILTANKWRVSHNNFVGVINLPPLKKKRGRWVSRATPKNTSILPLPIPNKCFGRLGFDEPVDGDAIITLTYL